MALSKGVSGRAGLLLLLLGTGPSACETAAVGSGEKAADLDRPRQFSLLIGIGDYRWAEEWKDLEPLRGPVNDVARVSHSLTRWGFSADPAAQRVLLDEGATREGIERGLRWLAESVRDSSDVVVIYYSGHGSWAADQPIDDIRRLDETLTAPGDAFDEALVPYDARDLHDPTDLFLDDELRYWLDRIGTDKVTVIVDACFSGTITRGSPDPASPSAPRARGPSPPDHIVLGGAGWMDGGAGARTSITAAAAWEIAYERTYQPGGIVSGVLTRHLTDALDAASSSTRFDELISVVRARVGGNQTPQLEGARSAQLFHLTVTRVLPANAVAVSQAGAGRLALPVGAAHGVRSGMYFDLSPADQAGRADRPLGQMRIDSVGVLEAFGSAVGMSNPLPERVVAVPSRVPYGATTVDRLVVYVDPHDDLTRRAVESVGEWVQVTGSVEGAVAEVRRIGDVAEVLVGGHALPPLPDDATNAARAGPLPRRGWAPTAEGLCAPLQRALSVVSMEAVANVPTGSTLDLRMSVLPAGRSAPTQPSSSVDTVRVGRRYDIWAWVGRAGPEDEVFFSAAVAGYTSRPTIVWPSDDRPNSPLDAHWLDQPLLLGTATIDSIAGIEEIIAVASVSPFDFRWLIQRLPDCNSGLSRSDGGGGPQPELVAVNSWTAITRRLLVVGVEN